MNTIASLIDTGYPVFTLEHRVGDVIRKFAETGLQTAPVLDGRMYAGMVRRADLSEPGTTAQEDGEATLSSIRLAGIPARKRDEHLLDSFLKIADTPDGVVPVTDENGVYLGVVFKSSLLRHLAGIFHFGEGVATIEIEVPAFGVKLSEVIAVIEKNDASVVSFGSQNAAIEGEGMILLFRIVTHDLFRLVKNLEKYGYALRYSSSYSDTGYDELREKALEFIRYIDM
jgi:acetoin utilization protein AcuB